MTRNALAARNNEVMIYQMLKFFKEKKAFHPEMILRPLFCFKDTKNTGLLIFNSLKQKKLIFNFFVNRNWKILTNSRKRAKILADNRKSHHPIETLFLVRFFEVHCTTNDVKPPNATIYEGRVHTTTSFPFSFRTSIKSIRIQLGERSPTFDKLPYY